MYERDAAAKSLGIKIDEVSPGYAVASMPIVASMLNGHDIVHGGFVFALADTAFAYACNSRDEANVALNATISFAKAARAGTKLIAVARERARSVRTGVYDVEVTSADGKAIAFFRGTSYRIRGSVTGS